MNTKAGALEGIGDPINELMSNIEQNEAYVEGRGNAWNEEVGAQDGVDEHSGVTFGETDGRCSEDNEDDGKRSRHEGVRAEY